MNPNEFDYSKNEKNLKLFFDIWYLYYVVLPLTFEGSRIVFKTPKFTFQSRFYPKTHKCLIEFFECISLTKNSQYIEMYNHWKMIVFESKLQFFGILAGNKFTELFESKFTVFFDFWSKIQFFEITNFFSECIDFAYYSLQHCKKF